MSIARIYQLPKTAMQSGRAKTKSWVLEFDKAQGQFTEPLMGWNGTTDTLDQIRLFFPTVQAAKAYADSLKLDVEIGQPLIHKPRQRSYADNFR